MALLVGVFLRFFSIIQASIEQVSVDVSFLNFQQMIRYQNMVSGSKDKNCKILENPSLFKGMGIDGLDTLGDARATSGGWSYDSKNHSLSYTVHSNSYFRSKIDHKIVIGLYCKNGVVGFNVSDYQWCRDKRFWGCQSW
jgi:hypothetical protein